MNEIARFVSERLLLAWILAIAAIVPLSWLVGDSVRAEREEEHLQQLAVVTERRAAELIAQTLNGSLMGSLSLLGLVDPEIKAEGRAGGKAGFALNSPRMAGMLESVARSHNADGVFLVAANGLVASSWDVSGRPSSGLDVRFRPYYQMAMQGRENVYAAVSIARGDRALYFAAPIYPGNRKEGAPIGAVVGRTSVVRVDELLREPADIALLLSPQGLVFASSRKEWLGHLSGEPTPERLQAIRELRQFGEMFDKDRPSVLPLTVADGLRHVDGRRHAVASARVDWNDPAGDWKLVFIEDLARSVPVGEQRRTMARAALIMLLTCALAFGLLRSRHRQRLAVQQLDAYARAQEEAAERKSQLAAAGLQLQQARHPRALAEAFLREAHKLLGALQGVVYVAEDGVLKRAACYACSDGDELPERLRPGEGLLGQCALDRRTQVLASAPPGFATIRSGLGESRPAALLIAPVQLKENLLGVVELALLTAPNDTLEEQFEDFLRLLAMNLEIVVGGTLARSTPSDGPGGQP